MKSAVVHFGWHCQVGSGGSSSLCSEQMIVGEDEQEVLDQLCTLVEKYYEPQIKKAAPEVNFGFLEDGKPISMDKLKEKYSVKVFLIVGLEPKKEKRKAKVERRAK